MTTALGRFSMSNQARACGLPSRKISSDVAAVQRMLAVACSFCTSREGWHHVSLVVANLDCALSAPEHVGKALPLANSRQSFLMGGTHAATAMGPAGFSMHSSTVHAQSSARAAGAAPIADAAINPVKYLRNWGIALYSTLIFPINFTFLVMKVGGFMAIVAWLWILSAWRRSSGRIRFYWFAVWHDQNRIHAYYRALDVMALLVAQGWWGSRFGVYDGDIAVRLRASSRADRIAMCFDVTSRRVATCIPVVYVTGTAETARRISSAAEVLRKGRIQ